MSAKTREHGYMPQLDALRFFAVMGVVLVHNRQPSAHTLIVGQVDWAELGVRLFLVREDHDASTSRAGLLARRGPGGRSWARRLALSTEAGLIWLLSRRENARLLGVLAGLSGRASRRALDSVRERSQLGDAFDEPVSTYSQGMRARLGFAVAVESDPRILLLDEVHEALDRQFRDIVEEQARALVEAGGVVVASGHDHAMLARLCTRAIWLQDGRSEKAGRSTRCSPGT